MMTTVAALFGTLPIALGYGEGADARQPLARREGVGGLVVSQWLTRYITPVIYLYMERFQGWMRGRKGVPARAVELARDDGVWRRRPGGRRRLSFRPAYSFNLLCADCEALMQAGCRKTCTKLKCPG
jgi:hypothetical protein